MTKPGKKPVSRGRAQSLGAAVWELIEPRRKALALGLLLIGIGKVAGFVLPYSSRFLIDDVILKKQKDLLAPLVLAVLAATLVQGATSYSLTQLLSKSAQRIITELRCKVQQHIGRLPVAYYDATKTGALVSRIMTDVDGIRNLVGTGLVEVVGGVLTVVIALTLLFTISPILAGSALVIIFGFVAVLWWAFKTLRPIYRQRGKINADVTGRLTESLGGVRVVKGYHQESSEADVFAAGAGRLLANILKTLTGTAMISLAATLVMGLVGALIMYLGAKEVLSGSLQLGELGSFTAILLFVVSPLYRMVNIGTQMTEALAGLERTHEVLSEHREDEDPRRSVPAGRIQGEVTFENVSFAYKQGKTVLQAVSFEATPGTVTALVGRSGSGKSTIIGLVAAFYNPFEGQVRVDGTDLSTVQLSSYRSQLGVVLQDTFLFAGTIRENVAFARPDATGEEILAACRLARVDEFAEEFEDRYETIVGERGIKLSGGQRQRVSIARAILANPRILILDEATSSLDSESEALIQEGLLYLMKGRTTFVIAHRLSTIRQADQILVIEDGRILERGTHTSLYRAGGRYYDLYTKQHGIEENLFLAPGEGDQVQEPEKEVAKESNDLEEALRLLGE